MNSKTRNKGIQVNLSFPFCVVLSDFMGLNALGRLISHLLMSLAIGMVMLCTCIAYWSTVGNINMQAQNQPSRQLPHQITQDNAKGE